jgi:phospho-N-acetylmuramoyl-pentapeptide-transferase
VIALLVAGAVAMIISLLGTPLLIRALERRGIGQPIREEGPKGHSVKAGTPTMGGIAIVAAAVAGYLISDFARGRIYTRSGILVMLAIVGAGLVGFLDDGIKVLQERNLGLNKRTKTLGLLTVAVGFAVLAVHWANVTTTIGIARSISPGWDLGPWGWGAFAVVLIYATTNAVNLTDGLDGLAAGSGAMAFGTLAFIGFWQSRPEHLPIYGIDHALDMAVIAVAMVGACAGFLWWNAAPARIFMGDTGSLAIGAGLATLALMTNTPLLLPLLGGIFVMETVSVILQVGSFRIFHRRVFRMAPIHHHFELAGWPETTVIIRFWILAALCAAGALGVFYADFIRAGGIDL